MTFEERIQTRRLEILDRASNDLSREAWCRAIFVSGSLAAEALPDPWADIDLRVVVDDRRYLDVLAQKDTFPERWGDVVYLERVPVRHLTIAHYRPFLKMDVFYYDSEALRPDPHWTRPQLVLFDPEHVVEALVAASRALPPGPGLDPAWFLSRATAAAEEVVRKLRRGQLTYAQFYLHQVREHALGFVAARTDPASLDSPIRSLAHAPDLRATLEASYVPSEPAAITAALGALLASLRARTAPDDPFAPGLDQVRDVLSAL